MDSTIKKVKELLEEADPEITVTEAEDPLPKEPNGEAVSEPPVDPTTV
jgi:hypothetical protein